MTHPIPAAALDSRIAIVGTSGSGKTFTMLGLAERLLEQGDRVCIIDLLGACHGLRSNSAGDGPGYPVVIFGGEHADVPINEASASPLARMIAEGPFSCIVDLSDLKTMKARRSFMRDFAETIYEANKNPLHLIIDEADVWCLDEETELLTAEGWKRHDAVEVGMKAVCFDLGTETYSYGAVERVIRRQHDGPMVRLKTKGLDCLATPDHRVVLQRMQRGAGRYGLYPWTFCPAAKVPTCVGIPIGGAPVGDGCAGLTLEMARILGWVITDGSIHSRKAKTKVLTISQSHGTTKRGTPIANEMITVFDGIPGVKRYERGARVSTTLGREVKSQPSCEWYLGPVLSAELLGWLGDDIHRIPRAILRHGSLDQLQALFKGLLEGDGASQNGKDWSHFYPGIECGLADDFQELALRLGYSTSQSAVTGRTDICVSIATKRRAHWVRKPSRQNYSGLVWDITVPTGAFVARRNGRIFVTGNCPQKPVEPAAAILASRIDEIVRRGRIKGFTPWLITQRPAVLSKDVLSQADILIAMKLTASQDRNAIGAWIEGQADRADGKRILAELPGLPVGQGFVWAPALPMLQKVRFPLNRTFDSSRTPKRGEKVKAPKSVAEIDVPGMTSALAEAIQEAKDNDPKHLKSEVARLKRELANKPIAATPVDGDHLYKDGYDTGRQHGYAEGALAERTSWLTVIEQKIVVPIASQMANVKALEDFLHSGFPEPVTAPPATAHKAIEGAKQAIRYAQGNTAGTRTTVISRPAPSGPSAPMSKAEKMILTALAQYPAGRTKTQVAILTGYSSGGGGFNNAISSLSTKGWINRNGGSLVILPEGVTALGAYTPLPTGQALLDHWLGQVSKAERAILNTLAQAYPATRTKQQVAEITGYEAGGGGFNNALSRLRTLELITGRADLRASDDLFGA